MAEAGESMLARVLIVASSVLVQIALARAIFGTPFPSHPGEAMLAFLFVTAAFLGLGLLIAGLADNVPAVQALGQCIFLPMIMIGGVGVPRAVLPLWAQRIAGFMPGRYAVEVLEPCFNAQDGLQGAVFRLGALAVIGLAAGVSGAKLFRVSIAAVADLCADPRESEIARLVLRQINSAFEPATARQALAWIILNPQDGKAVTEAPELGLSRHPPERLVRQRSVIYAEKYLGRMLGKIPD